MALRLLAVLLTSTALVTVAAPSAEAASCLSVGVYQDRPSQTFAKLAKRTGAGLSVISTYVTDGQALDPETVALANARKARLLVTWQADNGTDTAKQPRYSLATIAAGKHDATLKVLGQQLKAVKKGVIVRLLPEPNTPWYPWSGTVNGNLPAQYTAAWRHAHKVLHAAAPKAKFLWSVFAQSIPATDANAIGAYFPGASQVDLVGAVDYNFGTVRNLTFATPEDLFATAYTTIAALANKPFWLAETGTTSTGGSASDWLTRLAGLRTTLPRLAGVVLYDQKDPTGDFRLKPTPPITAALKGLLKGACS